MLASWANRSVWSSFVTFSILLWSVTIYPFNFRVNNLSLSLAWARIYLLLIRKQTLFIALAHFWYFLRSYPIKGLISLADLYCLQEMQFNVDINKLIADNHSHLSYASAILPWIAPGKAQHQADDLCLSSLTDFSVCLSIHLVWQSLTFLFPKLIYI
jgi:hypothetical protein